MNCLIKITKKYYSAELGKDQKGNYSFINTVKLTVTVSKNYKPLKRSA